MHTWTIYDASGQPYSYFVSMLRSSTHVTAIVAAWRERMMQSTGHQPAGNYTARLYIATALDKYGH
jgi:hypothetical protein